MTVLLSGAGGLIGRALRASSSSNHTIRRLVRRQTRADDTDAFYWNPETDELDRRALDDVHAIIHLAGEPVLGRWTQRKRDRILESRVRGTRVLLEAAALTPSVHTVISASAVGYYGCASAESVATESAECGQGFLAEVCRQWEGAAEEAFPTTDNKRLVLARIGVVLSPEGGALALMLKHARRARLVMIAGHGQQPIPWISMPDTVRALRHALDNTSVRGPVNLVAPSPVTQGELARAVAHRCRARAIRAPGWALRLTAGELAREVILAGRAVQPDALLRGGFGFNHTSLDACLDHALAEEDPT